MNIIDKELKDLRERLEAKQPIPSAMQVHRIPVIKTMVQELRAAITANPDHPVAVIYKAAIEKLPKNVKPERVLNVEKPDLQALLDNAEVITERAVEDVDGEARLVVTKRVGEPLKKSAKPARPPAAIDPKELPELPPKK